LSNLVITKGGTYVGSWESTDPKTPAVVIQTDEPVVIRDSRIVSRTHCILSRSKSLDLTVHNVHGIAQNPNVLGQSPGRFASLTKVRKVVVTNCTLDSTAGIFIGEYIGKRSGDESIVVARNKATNIDGRFSDGVGGYLPFNSRRDKRTGVVEEGFRRVQFLQLGRCTAVPGVNVVWNSIHNDPFESRVEDNINLWYSSGTPDSPIRVANNYINGAFPILPTTANGEDEEYTYNNGYSGGGIISDGGGTVPPNCKRSAHIHMFRNTVLNTTNYGCSAAHGNNTLIEKNRILATPYLGGEYIVAMNVGVSVGDLTKEKDGSYYNNRAVNNAISFARRDAAGKLFRVDTWLRDTARDGAGVSLSVGNISILARPKDTDILDSHVQEESLRWERWSRFREQKIGYQTTSTL